MLRPFEVPCDVLERPGEPVREIRAHETIRGSGRGGARDAQRVEVGTRHAEPFCRARGVGGGGVQSRRGVRGERGDRSRGIRVLHRVRGVGFEIREAVFEIASSVRARGVQQSALRVKRARRGINLC